MAPSAWWRGRPSGGRGLREAAALRDHCQAGAFATVNGARVHYVRAGQGPDLVLIHGASGSLREFTFRLIPLLAETCHVLAFDRPGLGLSDPLPRPDAVLAEIGRAAARAALR